MQKSIRRGCGRPYGAALAAAESVILPKKRKKQPPQVAPKVLVCQSAFAVASWALRYPAQNTSAMKV